ncbi:hypothetical protein N7493_007308 [Penicillium malachiteum]|uniref:Uncharacterized protein n=1 Tax=Penicillium malachiteum TaxID=1324776 RepID=A0AAD6HIZ5_9EURO|nr:hypothetical protein N7493_007308 [Penicillium malachiteum]
MAGSPTLANAESLTEDLTSPFVKYFETQCWNKNSSTPTPPSRNIFFLIGPCGCGKSTAAQALNQQHQIPTIEGDSFHSPLAR